MEDNDGGLHPAVDGQSLGERWKEKGDDTIDDNGDFQIRNIVWKTAGRPQVRMFYYKSTHLDSWTVVLDGYDDGNYGNTNDNNSSEGNLILGVGKEWARELTCLMCKEELLTKSKASI